MQNKRSAVKMEYRTITFNYYGMYHHYCYYNYENRDHRNKSYPDNQQNIHQVDN